MLATPSHRLPLASIYLQLNFYHNHVVKISLRYIPNDWDFPDDADSKESACSAGELGSTPGSGKSPGSPIITFLRSCNQLAQHY